MKLPDGRPPEALTIMHETPEAGPHMFPYAVYTYSWGQITLHIAAVLADSSLPDELVAPLVA